MTPKGFEFPRVLNSVVVQFGLRAGPVKREIPSLRLKSGCAQDDANRRMRTQDFKMSHYL